MTFVVPVGILGSERRFDAPVVHTFWFAVNLVELGVLIVTVTPTGRDVPPVPVQVAAKVVLAVRAPDETLVPDRVVCHVAPAFVIEQDVALVEVHVILDD